MASTPKKSQNTHNSSFPIAQDSVPNDDKSKKPKKPPPITPRRFTKFFTPRLHNARRAVRSSRSALRDITAGSVLNKTQHQAGPSASTEDETPRKKRKLSFSSPTSSLRSSPLRPDMLLSSSQEISSTILRPSIDALGDLSEVGEEDETDVEPELKVPQAPKIREYQGQHPSSHLLFRRIGGRRPWREPQQSQVWQEYTKDFCARPEDVHTTQAIHATTLSLPFCVASCNTNSLVAIGQEDGVICLVDSAADDRAGFKTTYLTMRPHDNAIMNLEFSSDDSLLATASGDQTAQVIDMHTQKSLHCLSGHFSSVKQVQFQPGSGNNVLATCSRDGCIYFWDLRCQSSDRPSFHLRSSRAAPLDNMTEEMQYSTYTNIIRDAHSLPPWRPRKSTNSKQLPATVTGRNEFSVTSLSFLGASRSHLAVTTSEVDAVVKLWDMRTTYTSRRGKPTPVSSTQEPANHENHRHFGITSLALGTDASRIYTLCRDHTVYAYSTSHLVLGTAPDITHKPFQPSRPVDPDQSSGPLYGFRHPQLRVSTFYPKLAIRKASAQHPELLAIGSSDDCAVLFPTDERFLTKENQIPPPLPAATARTVHPSRSLNRQSSFPTSTPHFSSHGSPHPNTPPIYHHGTWLTRAHRKEVTAVSWTSEGSLVTASDDFSVRCWRENPVMARGLRMDGEAGGRRWGCGWADVRKEADVDDDE